jgi:hypothetical protein
MIKRGHWKIEELKCSQREEVILHNWHLSLADTPTSVVVTNHLNRPTTWSSPAIGFIKINFDVTSKGNLGPMGFETLLKNSNGEIIHLTIGVLGSNTNNEAKLWTLLTGIKVAT